MRLIFFSIVTAIFSMAAVSLEATPDVRVVFPVGGQKGKELTITLRGNNLVEPKDLMFYHPGIEVIELKSVDRTKMTAKLRISDKAAIGEHPFRLRTAYGVSYQRTLWVGEFPVVQEIKEPSNGIHNNTMEKAQAVLPHGSGNCTVQGTIRTEDVDIYVLPRKKGQLLSVEIECMRLGRSITDPFVSILSPKGKPLGSSDDSPLLGQDGFLSLKVPEDGKYYVLVRDSSYRGNATSFYRLHVGEFVRPSMISPLAWSPNTGHDYTLIGEVGGEGHSFALRATGGFLLHCCHWEEGQCSISL